MAVTLTTFNVNNFFLRYKFGKRFPGDMSAKSESTDPRWGYLPLYKPGLFELFAPAEVDLAAQTLRLEHGPIDFRFARLPAVTKDLSASDHCPLTLRIPI